MQKIALVGACGSGKTTLAKKIAERSGLPLTHLDSIYWQPGWKTIDKEDYISRHAELIAQDRWIIDGNFSSTYEERFRAADVIILFSLPGQRGFWQAMWRTLKNFGRNRDDMAPGCPDRFSFDFIRYSWQFNRVIRPRILRAARAAGARDRLVVLRSRAEAEAWLERRLPKPQGEFDHAA